MNSQIRSLAIELVIIAMVLRSIQLKFFNVLGGDTWCNQVMSLHEDKSAHIQVEVDKVVL